MPRAQQHIVILGAGFGGVYVYKHLARLLGNETSSLSIINERDYFLFTPLLHEVATGGQTMENVKEPLASALGCGKGLRVTRATSVDPRQRVVRTEEGEVSYDYLALATGSHANFFEVPGAHKHCVTLKSLEDAVRLKNRIIAVAGQTKDPYFVVAGGGATGVELAAEIMEFARVLGSHNANVALIEQGRDLVPQFDARLREEALNTLQRKGIDVRLGTGVASVSRGSVTLSNSQSIVAHAVIWAAGIAPNAIPFAGDVKLAKNGAYVVNQYLQLAAYKNIFALGDVASFTNPGEEKPVPTHAQTAVAEAKAVAENIVRSIRREPLQAFAYRHTGDLVSLGRWRAVGDIAGISFSGRFAWWLWRTVYLSKLLTWRKRIAVATDWTIRLFCARDTSEL